MKTFLLLFLGLTLSVWTANAQIVVFEDDFEDHETGISVTDLGWVTWEGGAVIEEGDAYSGSKFVLCQPSNNNFYLRRPITLEAGKTYKYEVATKSPNGFNHRTQVIVGGTTIQGDLEDNDTWVVKEIEFTVGEGEEDVVLTVYSWPIQDVHVDDVKLIEVGEDPYTVVDVILESPDHATLAAAVADAGLVETLQGEGPFTVFAPTDDAFAALPDGLLDGLSVEQLTSILLYHVVGDLALSTDLADGQEIETLLGQEVVVTITNGTVKINDAEVTITDLEADNGVVHVIDAVLIPEEDPITVVDIIAGSEVHTILAAALTDAGLVETLQGEGPFTVFAPTDDAFAALPADLPGDLTDILLYHVVGALALSTDLTDGQEIETLLGQDVVVSITNGTVKINDAEVIIADLEADNGVVHVIDVVLVPDFDDVSVVDNILHDINIYPNPASSKLYISHASEISRVEIYNMTGSRVFSQVNISSEAIDISELNSGLYFISVIDVNNNNIVRKLVKQ